MTAVVAVATVVFFADGCVTSCGVLLVVAGAGKAYAGARGRGGGDAIRRALRVRRGRWPAVSFAAGAVECCVGAAVCAGLRPVPASAALAVLGAVFCALLGYVRLRRVPGGCGCLGWGAGNREATPRSIARAGLLACAGLSGALNPAHPPNDLSRLPFYPGLVAGGVVLALLSTGTRLRTPACGRSLWRPRATGAAALADSGVFQAMAAAAGPFGEAVYRRNGCTDEFWYATADGAGRGVLFRVSGGGRAVQATKLTDHGLASSLRAERRQRRDTT